MFLNTSSGSLRTTLKRTLYVRQVNYCVHHIAFDTGNLSDNSEIY